VKRRRRAWSVRLAAAAEGDYHAILTWTVEQFGPAQMRMYEETLIAALEAVSAGPTALGAKRVVDLPQDFCMLHAARRRRKGRHVIIFRVRRDSHEEWIEVVRILHDSTDMTRHLSS
jgi:toxin ParE1/3/4